MQERKIQEECGVFGIYAHESRTLSREIYYGLYALQHRGQESAGIAVSYGNKVCCIKNKGLVAEVFDDKAISEFPEGDIAVGHVRYATKDALNIINVQPIVFSGKAGAIAVCVNGKITNSDQLRKDLISEGFIFQTDMDGELISVLINKNTHEKDISVGIEKTVQMLEGSYAIVIMTPNELFGIRDKFGLKPLVIGKNFHNEYYLSSESCALDAVGAMIVRDVAPGEIVKISSNGLASVTVAGANKRSCIFEFVYLARADSIIDGRSVYEARFECGRMLARKFQLKGDIVAGVPDSAVVSARGYAAESGLPYIDVLEKNRYVGRTFIQPDQIMRENSVKIKLNAHRANISGKKVILIDDSIVRGTTSRKIVDMLKKMGAKEVHMVISSPVVKHPCYLGVDIETYEQLIGANKSVDEIRKAIGADSLSYMTVEELCDCCGVGGDDGFCTGCFDGNYPIQFKKNN